MITVVEDLDSFKAALKAAGDKLVVVDFTATWCGPCKQIAPEFASLSSKPENKNVIFLKVDVDEAEEVSVFCKIKCMPTFQYYKNEVMVYEFSGNNPQTLRDQVEALRT